MKAQQDFFADTKLAVENYVENRILLLKLEATEKISKLAGAMFSGLLIAVMSFFIILFISMMIAWYFGQLLNNVYLGFGIISAFYIVVLILLLIFRKKVLERTITNTVINIFFEKTAHDHDNGNGEK
jgi:membrane protein implicated in regulation of membrane protease activity